jgi:uncharacterized membrane protein
MTPWAKRLAVALAISVGLNLLLAGMMLGRKLSQLPPESACGPAGFGPRFGGGQGQGPGRRSQALREAIGRNRGAFDHQRKAIGRARMEARDALRRDPFDRAALEGTLSNLRAETARSQEAMHRAIVEAAQNAAPAERRALARDIGPRD